MLCAVQRRPPERPHSSGPCGGIFWWYGSATQPPNTDTRAEWAQWWRLKLSCSAQMANLDSLTFRFPEGQVTVLLCVVLDPHDSSLCDIYLLFCLDSDYVLVTELSCQRLFYMQVLTKKDRHPLSCRHSTHFHYMSLYLFLIWWIWRLTQVYKTDNKPISYWLVLSDTGQPQSKAGLRTWYSPWASCVSAGEIFWPCGKMEDGQLMFHPLQNGIQILLWVVVYK